MSGIGLREWKSEKGSAQIIEASVVFPVMFIVLIFMIFMGNVFFVRSQVEAVVTQEAIRGAGFCADPLLQIIKENGSLPSVKDLKTEPYRYIFGGMDDIENKIRDEVKNSIGNGTLTAFGGMSPRIDEASGGLKVEFHNMVIYSTFSVEVNYKIQFPIRMLGQRSPTVLKATSRSEVAVNDVSEFIRNTDMVLDLFDGSKTAQFIKNLFGKINDFIHSFSSM